MRTIIAIALLSLAACDKPESAPTEKTAAPIEKMQYGDGGIVMDAGAPSPPIGSDAGKHD